MYIKGIATGGSVLVGGINCRAEMMAMTKFFVFLRVLSSYALPTSVAYTVSPYAPNQSTFIEPVPAKMITIFKQINQVNDDGSYTFGYEASDGTFRMEHKDVNGYVLGKFGYIDTDGQLQISEYIAGINTAGRSLGYKSMGLSTPLNFKFRYAPLESVDNSKILQNAESTTLDTSINNFRPKLVALDKSLETTKANVTEPTKAVSKGQPKFFQYGQSIFRSSSEIANQTNLLNSEKLPPVSQIDKFLRNLNSKVILVEARYGGR